jgi:hypothetical protein
LNEDTTKMRTTFITLCGIVLSAALLSGCPKEPAATTIDTTVDTAVPAPDTVETPTAPNVETPAVVAAPKAPAAAPAPIEQSRDALADKAPGFDPSNPDRSCKTDSDCVVKDVGNCCGRFPACVNKNAKTDPAAVRAQCAKDGMASICGFEEITACQCVEGQCQSAAGGAVAM